MPPEIMFILAGAFLAAYVAGAAGFGDGVMAASVWLHVLSPLEVVPLILSIGILIHGISLIKLWRQLDFSQLLPFLIPGIVGVPVGVWLLQYASPDIFKISIGTFLLGYSLLMLFLPKITIQFGGKALNSVFGATGGVIGGFAGLTGIIPAIWCGLRGWPKEQQRGVFQPFLVVLDILAIIVLAWNGQVTAQTGVNLLWCLPAIIIGIVLGLKTYKHVNDQVFKRIVLILILFSGVMLVI